MSTTPSSLADAVERLKAIVGPGCWLTGAGDVEPYVRDWRGTWSGRTPIVLRPGCTEEIAKIVRTCAAAGLHVTPQSGNTGLVGGGSPDETGLDVVVSLNRMTAIRDVDPLNNTITVEAGCILADVQAAAAEADRLYPLSLAAEGSCRIGGALSTNAGGTNVLRYGNAREHVLGLEVVLADGRTWNGLRSVRKDNTGYDLKQLFLGSEGTLGIVTAAVLRLWPRPRCVVTAWLGVPGTRAAVEVLARAQTETGGQVTGFEYMTAEALDLTFANLPANRSPLPGRHPGCVLMEAAAGRDDGALRGTLEGMLATALDEGLVGDAVIAESGAQAATLWRIREEMPEAQVLEGGVISHDIAVPADRIADFLEQAARKVGKIAPEARIIAFGHLGDGNMHFNLCAGRPDRLDALLPRKREINDSVESLAVGMGGSFSAEHGIGRERLRQMSRYKTEVELDLMTTIKRALDPRNALNPGKVVAFREDR